MKFQVGDKVRFLNEKGEGIVTKIMSNGMVNVALEDGFEFPFPESQLVKAFQPEVVKPETADSVITDIAPEPIKRDFFISRAVERPAESIFVVFEATNNNAPENSDLNLLLVNNTKVEFHFSYSQKHNNEFNGLGVVKADAGEKIVLAKIKRTDVEKWSVIRIQGFFFKKGAFIPPDLIDELVKIKPYKFYKENSYKTTALTSNKALVIDLLQSSKPEDASDEAWNGEGVMIENIAHHIFTKENQKSTKVSKQHIQNSGLLEKEVDLHIEELQSDFRGMSNAAIIQVQLKHFQNELDEAIAARMSRIVFIHGVGNGRLKHEVQRILKTYSGIQFHDASYHRYGFGATEVIIK